MPGAAGENKRKFINCGRESNLTQMHRHAIIPPMDQTGEHLPTVRLYAWLFLLFLLQWGRKMHISMWWPIVLIVLSNIFYHICSKQTPDGIHPLASLTITYLVAAIGSGGLYCMLNRGGSLLREYRNVNWTAFVLGIAIIGLEAGSIYMYKAGWNINTGQLIHSTILAVVLIFVGYFLYHETITWTKAAGIFMCLIGLVFISKG